MATVDPITNINTYDDKTAPQPSPVGQEHLRVRAVDLNALKARLTEHAAAINTSDDEIAAAHSLAATALAAAGGVAPVRYFSVADDDDMLVGASNAGEILIAEVAAADRPVALLDTVVIGHTQRVMRSHAAGPNPAGEVLFVTGTGTHVILGPDRIAGSYSVVTLTCFAVGGGIHYWHITPEAG